MEMSKIILLLQIIASMLTQNPHNGGSSQAATTYTDTWVFEDFEIEQEFIHPEDGKGWRGELIGDTGEGIYLLESELAYIPGAPKDFEVGDEIEVCYLREDYDNSIFDNIQSIEFIN